MPAAGGEQWWGLSTLFSRSAAAASVGYYFAVYLPARDAQLDRERRLEAAQIEYSKQSEQARVAAEKRVAEEKQIAAQAAVQSRYQSCVRTAENNYNASWAQACKMVSDKSAKGFKDCVSGGSTKEWCDKIWTDRNISPDCTLPRAVGTDIDNLLENSRKRCLEESRAGLR